MEISQRTEVVGTRRRHCTAEAETSGVHQDPSAMETCPSDMDDAPTHSGVPHQRTPQETSASPSPQRTLQLSSQAQTKPWSRTSTSGTGYTLLPPPPPPTNTADASSPSSAISPVETGWKERRGIVNKSKLLELFHTCHIMQNSSDQQIHY
ncbi:unnamed protein product [Boreogadus saida]